MPRLLLASLLALVLTACHTDWSRVCLGDGPAYFDDLSVSSAQTQVAAGSVPVVLTASGHVYCSGQYPGLTWTLDPPIGTLAAADRFSQDAMRATYTPPKTLSAPVTVTVTVYASHNTYQITSSARITVTP